MRLRITLKPRLISNIFSKRLQPTHRKKASVRLQPLELPQRDAGRRAATFKHNTLLHGVKKLLSSKSSAIETKVILLLELESMIVQPGSHRVRPQICHLS